MISITVKGPSQEQKFAGLHTPCLLGRQSDDANPDLRLEDPFASRRHVELQEQPTGQLLVRCIGGSAIGLTSGETIEPNDSQIVDMPVELRIGRSNVVVEALNVNVSFLKAPAAIANQQGKLMSDTLCLAADADIQPDRLIDWFEELIALQESAIGTKGFFEQDAKAVVEMVGLDRCVVLSLDDQDWRIEVEHGNRGTDDVVYSRSVVNHVFEFQQTVFDNSVDLSQARSLSGVSAFVGSPIFDGHGAVVACLFGVRNLVDQTTSEGIRPLEAQLVQVVAGIVGSRMARLAAEAEQTRAQIQLEQFASPQLVREMQNNPQWLEAQQRELTLLFGDIRGFSRLGERLTADQIYAFVRDTMDCLTNAIHTHGGFVFNYAGDGIAAMWNAPSMTASHAIDACRAAIEMQNALTQVDAKWSKLIGKSVQVGIGINTGTALVGNSGSKARLKYSPLGHSVNLASRVEGATKHFGVRVLVTEATAQLIGPEFPLRDLGEIVVVGIDQSTRVFELATSGNVDFWTEYEEALGVLERGDEVLAVTRINELAAKYPDDGPTKALIQRITESAPTAGPWVLPQK